MYDYVALLEVTPLGECSVLDASSVAGAMVRVYVHARTEAAARGAIRSELAAQRLAVVDTEWLVRDDEVEWEDPEDSAAAEAIALARDTGAVVFGEFHTWSHDAPDA